MSTQAIEPSGPKPQSWLEWERIVVYGFLFLTAAYFLVPLYIVIITSLKNLDEIANGNIFIPTLSPTLHAWYRAWFEVCTGLDCRGIHPNFMNSVYITVPSVVVFARCL